MLLCVGFLKVCWLYWWEVTCFNSLLWIVNCTFGLIVLLLGLNFECFDLWFWVLILSMCFVFCLLFVLVYVEFDSFNVLVVFFDLFWFWFICFDCFFAVFACCLCCLFTLIVNFYLRFWWVYYVGCLYLRVLGFLVLVCSCFCGCLLLFVALCCLNFCWLVVFWNSFDFTLIWCFNCGFYLLIVS